jgi:hypothetical protein
VNGYGYKKGRISLANRVLGWLNASKFLYTIATYLLTKKISAFAILISFLPALAQSESALPTDHFTGLTLDTHLQTSFTTGKAIRLSGILTDTSFNQINFPLTPDV